MAVTGSSVLGSGEGDRGRWKEKYVDVSRFEKGEPNAPK